MMNSGWAPKVSEYRHARISPFSFELSVSESSLITLVNFAALS